MREKSREFLRNIVDVDVDGWNGINYYTIYKEYLVIYEDEDGEWAENELEILDQFDYTWQQIKRDGGIDNVNKEISEVYNIAS